MELQEAKKQSSATVDDLRTQLSNKDRELSEVRRELRQKSRDTFGISSFLFEPQMSKSFQLGEMPKGLMLTQTQDGHYIVESTDIPPGDKQKQIKEEDTN